MPDGLMQWYDAEAGEGRIVHNGRRFVARDTSTEPKARVPGARVHFDIDAHADGAVAVDVKLRPGTRVSRRQRRFGDLTGSATVDSKGAAPFAQPHPELGRDLQRHPMRVAELWAALVAAGNTDEATLLYAPNASLHAAGEVLVGMDRIRGHLASLVVGDSLGAATVRGDGDTAIVRWGAPDVGDDALETRLRIRRGEITEQWLRTVWTTTDDPAEGPTIEYSAAGAISAGDRDHAMARMKAALATTASPVLHATIRLELAADPARERPAQAQASVDFDGEPVRAHARAGSPIEAVDLLEAKLRRQLGRVVERRRTIRRRAPTSAAGEWRHGEPPTEPDGWHPREREDRAIVRHKTFGPSRATVDEAAFDLDVMDYDFYLFTDLGTGQDALVQRRDGTSPLVQHLDGSVGAADEPTSVAVEALAHPAPSLTAGEARERLDAGHEPWVFFKDRESGRGHVLYRRHDGHYGLITPSDEPVSEDA